MAQTLKTSAILQIIFILNSSLGIESQKEDYLRYVKDGCYIRGEALSCVKYKAIKLAKTTLFGSHFGNETIRANHMISFVPLDEETLRKMDENEIAMNISQPRGFFSEWTELTRYIVNLVKDFFKTKGLRVDLPEGARTIEDEADEGIEEGRGKKKKLALIIPFLTLLAALKTKLLLLPILLSVLLIKKLLLAAALLIPSLLHTLKICKVHHHSPAYSYFGSSDSSDFSTGYNNNNYAYSSGGGYGKPGDWASNRAYSMQKPRPTPSPMYITAPGGVA